MIHKPDPLLKQGVETCRVCGATRMLFRKGYGSDPTPWMLAGKRQRYCMGSVA